MALVLVGGNLCEKALALIYIRMPKAPEREGDLQGKKKKNLLILDGINWLQDLCQSLIALSFSASYH